MAERRPVIAFENFSFQYRAQAEPTLRDIDLTIYEGEIVLIAGPSGSGKSTLAHCINGLAPKLYPGTMMGSLRILGREQREMSIYDISEMVGTVLQDPDGQFVGLTVGEDIAFRLENDEAPPSVMKESVRKAAAAVGIDDRLDASPQMLSGGQKQKVALAGALANDVGILLFDEPLASLDPKTGREAMERIGRLRSDDGKTIVIVEHRLEDVLHAGVDRVVLLRDGEIVADLPPRELLCTGLLAEAGIREPLYVSALKYAGCRVRPEMEPQRVDAVRLDGCVEPLTAWAEAAPPALARTKEAPALALEGVSFAYEPGRPVLRDVSFAIGRGEMASLVGRNGAGKSTLSQLICGFRRPTSGRIALAGEDAAGQSIRERARRVGYVMQNPNHMISKPFVFEEAAFGLRLRGEAPDVVEARTNEALRVCGLYEMRNWPISALSYGQKKRVTIASILTLEPDILLLDEPTAGQDYRHYTEFMTFLMELNRRGVAMLLVTHDMHLMLEYTDRAIVLADGRVAADGHPADVLSDRETAEAANLKLTSLYELAVRAGLARPNAFVRAFIAHERGRSRS